MTTDEASTSAPLNELIAVDDANTTAVQQYAEGAAKGVAVSLDQLFKLITADPIVPKIGATASQALMRCFEQTAADVEKLAQDHTARAEQLHQEAISFAESIRKMGDLFCRRIEEQTTRGAQVSNLMQQARGILEIEE